MRAVLVIGVGGLVLTGCAAHVDLQAPPASASVRTRVAAYDQLKGLSYHQTTVTTFGTMGSSTSHSTDYLQLANGTRVYYAEDLLVILPFTQSSPDHINGTPIAFGLGLAVVGGLGFGLAAHFVGEDAQDEAATAYETYDRSLLERLNLCVRGDALGDCGR